MDVVVWRVGLDIELYGAGSRDRTAWESSSRPHSLAEIVVAETGPSELHYLVKREYSRCCQPAFVLWIPRNYCFRIVGCLRQGLQP